MNRVSFATETTILWLEHFEHNLKKDVSLSPSHDVCGCEALSKKISLIQQNLQRGVPLSSSEGRLISYLLSDLTPLEEPSLLSFITRQLRELCPSLLKDMQEELSAKASCSQITNPITVL